MRPELRGIEANDICEWPRWSPSGPAEEHQWFSVSVGLPGTPGTNLFQVAVATPAGLRERRRNGRFVGLVVDRFEPRRVEEAIRSFVEAAEGPDWDGIVRRLSASMRWEYGR
jgi:Immunity protein 8